MTDKPTERGALPCPNCEKPTVTIRRENIYRLRCGCFTTDEEWYRRQRAAEYPDKPTVQPGDTLPDTVPYLRRQVECLQSELAVTQLAHGRLTAERDGLLGLLREAYGYVKDEWYYHGEWHIANNLGPRLDTALAEGDAHAES